MRAAASMKGCNKATMTLAFVLTLMSLAGLQLLVGMFATHCRQDEMQECHHGRGVVGSMCLGWCFMMCFG